MKVKKETWIRTAVLVFSLVNQLLIACDLHPLPFSEEEAYEGISAVLTVVVSLWSWWKNNSFSKDAILADDYLKNRREERKNG